MNKHNIGHEIKKKADKISALKGLKYYKDYEQPVVVPQESHFKQEPFLTIVKL